MVQTEENFPMTSECESNGELETFGVGVGKREETYAGHDTGMVETWVRAITRGAFKY